MNRHITWIILAALTSGLFGSPAQSQEVETPPTGRSADDLERILTRAENDWIYGDYAAVVVSLETILLPQPDPGLSPPQLVQGYVLLASSHFFQGQTDRSERVFYVLLLLEPDFELDPLLYPGRLIDYLNDLRQKYREELDVIREERAQDPGNQGSLRFVERRVEERSFIVSILPFGIGHFVNDQPIWGIVYLVTELALGGTSAGMYLVNEAERDPQGFFTDVEAAESRQDIQVVSAIAFFSVVAINIAHGALIHEDVVQTSYEIIDAPGEGVDGDDEDEQSRGWPAPEDDAVILTWGFAW